MVVWTGSQITGTKSIIKAKSTGLVRKGGKNIWLVLEGCKQKKDEPGLLSRLVLAPGHGEGPARNQGCRVTGI
jgi:hypothetical protein